MSFKHFIVQPLTLLTIAGFSASVAADVTIAIPKDVDLLVANAEKAKPEGSFFSSAKSITLPDGENQIVFRYSPIFRQGGEQTTVNTEAIIAKFSASDSKLSLEMPQYYDAKKARTFDANPTWKLVDDKGNIVEVKQDKLIRDGVQLGRQYDYEVQAYNKKGGIASIAPTNTSVSAVATSVAATSATVTPTVTTPSTQQASTNKQYQNQEEQMLHYWYEKADNETKQRFIQSVIQAK